MEGPHFSSQIQKQTLCQRRKSQRMKLLQCTAFLLAQASLYYTVDGLSLDVPPLSRRAALGWITGASTAAFLGTQQASAEGQLAHPVDTERFLSTGRVASPMVSVPNVENLYTTPKTTQGISGQGSKSRPQTGVLLRDGSEPERDTRTGDVSAEILLTDKSGTRRPVLLSFRSEEWPLATGPFYDLECRDSNTGDSAFVAVTPNTGGKSLQEIEDSFIVNAVFGPLGRFAPYGEPTDIKVHKSHTEGDYRAIEVTFSTLSQSTQTEVPRHAKLFATVPDGMSQAVVLVGSSSETRWKKGSDSLVARVGDTFRAIPAPRSELKMKAKPRPSIDVENV
eukprot:scaffold10056_cov164-Amphora_coffeaeformis.AAC.13